MLTQVKIIYDQSMLAKCLTLTGHILLLLVSASQISLNNLSTISYLFIDTYLQVKENVIGMNEIRANDI